MIDAIKRYLEMTANPNVVGNKFAEFILTHGREWTPASRPKHFKKGRPRQCFSNSQQELLRWQEDDDDDLTYVEGLACSGVLDFPFPVTHGWLVDPEGRVIDLTWDKPAGSAYFGVPFQTAYVRGVAHQTGFFGSLLENLKNNFALLRGEHKVEDAIKPWVRP